MDNATLQSPYFLLVLLIIRLLLFETSMSGIHSNSLKLPILESHEGRPYFFINDAG